MNRLICSRESRGILRGLLVALAAPLVLVAADPAPQTDAFGARIDPAGDCTFSTEGGRLTIAVPGSKKPHDLAAELSTMSAPLVVQEVSGDFVVEVRVDGVSNPGGRSTQRGRSGYFGAGLVVFANDRNYASIQRATLQWEGKKGKPYTNFELRVDGQLPRGGKTGDFDVESAKPTWLRLERKGRWMLGAMSHDGKKWTYGEPKELTDPAWNRKDLVVGMTAVSTSLRPFTPDFSGFSIAAPGEAAPEELPDTVQVADSNSSTSDETAGSLDIPDPSGVAPLAPADQDLPKSDDGSADTPPSPPAEGSPMLALARPGSTFQMLDGIRAVIRGWAAGQGVGVTVSYRDATTDGSPARVLRLVPVDKGGTWQFEVPDAGSKHLRMTFRAVDQKLQTSPPVTITAKRKPQKE